MSEPNNHIFINAKQYLNIARYADEYGALSDVSIAVISNYAFSVELMLKALDAKLLPPMQVQDGLLAQTEIQTSIRSHNLYDIFKSLPADVQQHLEANFRYAKNTEIESLLRTCGDYFVLSRYYHEPQSKIPYRISDIRLLAEGLERAILLWYA